MSERPKIIRPAAYTLITQGASLLLARLCPTELAAGKWTLPGGGLDFGEAPESGAIRETMEETGLSIELGSLLEVQSQLFTYPERELQALRFIYAVRSWSGDIRDEVDGSTDTCAFIPFDALQDGYRHESFGAIDMVELARRGMELASAYWSRENP